MIAMVKDSSHHLFFSKVLGAELESWELEDLDADLPGAGAAAAGGAPAGGGGAVWVDPWSQPDRMRNVASAIAENPLDAFIIRTLPSKGTTKRTRIAVTSPAEAAGSVRKEQKGCGSTAQSELRA
jgi:hypothetical protein